MFASHRLMTMAAATLVLVLLWSPAGSSAVRGGPTASQAAATVYLYVGKSHILDFPSKLQRASVTEPTIASVVILSPTQLLINGKAPGVTSLMVWDEANGQQMYDVDVRVDESQLIALLRTVAPHDYILVHSAQDSIVLTGEVQRPSTITKAQEVAETFSPRVVNLLRIIEPQQIMLKVRFIEVDRTAAQDVGLNFVAQGNKFFVATQPNKSSVIQFDQDNPAIADLLYASASQFFGKGRIGSGSGQVDFAPVLKLLEQKDLARVLAEPNLLAKSGEEASFLAGGELPIPLITSTSATVEFKEFGVRLKFTPEITDTGSIQLKVAPEVSSLDFASSVTIGDSTIPGLKTRKTETTVELYPDETLAIGGLLSQETTRVASRVPMASDLPIIGDLFKSTKFQKGETELLVLVSPSIVQPTRGLSGKPLSASQDMAPFLNAGREPFDDAQGGYFRSQFGARRESVWESDQEADPYLDRPERESSLWSSPEWKQRSNGSASGFGAPETDSAYHESLQKYELAIEDPAYEHISGMLKHRLRGGASPTHTSPSIYEMLGYQPVSW